MGVQERAEKDMGFRIVEALCEYAKNPIGIDVKEPRFSWVLDHPERSQAQSAYRVLVASSASELAADRADQWDSGKIASDQSVNVPYRGAKLASGRTYYWKVRAWDANGERSAVSEAAVFETGLLDASDWKTGWVGHKGGMVGEGLLFRKEFRLDKEVSRARAYISGLGYYELSINGKKVGDNVLDPGWTEYNKTVLYVTHDVTSHVKRGANAIGVMLGNGWFGEPKLLFQMNVEFSDGTAEVIHGGNERVVDVAQGCSPSWQFARAPIVRNSVYDGETYDARLEKPGWDMPGFVPDGRTWFGTRHVEGPCGELKAQMLEPIKVVGTMEPVRITSPKPGVYVYDMGQNFAGWCRLSVEGQRGAAVEMKYSELLYPDGTVNQENLVMAQATAVYVLKGEGVETYEPRFTYFGFRYVQVTGFPGTPSLGNLTGCIVRSSVEKTGDFSCSNPLFNAIHGNIVWTEANNLHSLPTDCPQRSERLGWLNDMTVRAEEAIYNFNIVRLYTKWLRDIRDAQDKESGAIPDTAPYLWGMLPGDPVDCYLFVAWYLYLYYDDTRILEEYYDGIKRWVDYLDRQAEGFIIPYARYGDWCTPVKDCFPQGAQDLSPEHKGAFVGCGSYPFITPGILISTVYYYFNVHLLSRIANAVGKNDDCTRYAELAGKIKVAFNERFFNPETGNYATGSQGSNAIPLFLGLVPEGKRSLVVDNIVRDIKAHGGHLSTGNQCTKYMFEALTECGAGDAAYGMMNTTTYPGWGFMIEKGATTIWERWEELTGSGMNSHDHPMMGSIGAWFYKHLAGIQADPEAPGWRAFRVKPFVVGDLDHVNSSLRTVRGRISVQWWKKPGEFILEVTVPVNSRARVHIPLLGMTGATVAENGATLWDGKNGITSSPDVGKARSEDGCVVVEVGSGSYRFNVTKGSTR